jgi:hypothetical protein
MFRKNIKWVIDEIWEDIGGLLRSSYDRAEDCIWLEKQVETIKDRLDDLECDYKQLWNDRVDHEILRSNVLRRLEALEDEKRRKVDTITYWTNTYTTGEGDVYPTSNTAPTGSSTGNVDKDKQPETKRRGTRTRS